MADLYLGRTTGDPPSGLFGDEEARIITPASVYDYDVHSLITYNDSPDVGFSWSVNP